MNRRDPEAMTRLTIDVPASLHARIKSQCALRGVKMADEVRELLEKHFQPSWRRFSIKSYFRKTPNTGR